MGKTLRPVSVVGMLLLGGLVLAGCTGTPDPVVPPTTGAASAAANTAIILAVQKESVEKNLAPRGTVVKQFTGTGPATLHIDPLPEGQKSLGSTVICTGSGRWETTIQQKKPSSGGSGCSMDGGNSVTYPLEDPSREQTVDIKVENDVQFWVTIYSTE